MKVLDDMKINYQYNTPHGLNRLRWDFLLKIDNELLFIEYNGAQHYKPVCFGGISQELAEANFIKQKTHDTLKTEYAQTHDHELLWIHHQDYTNIENLVQQFIIFNTNWDGDRHEPY